ncbi:uncharacterized protein Tco025E_00129 [Trypanosoma conorhini]|uniref:Uncharacterized protein n=1 Tax=Trypanosoma conorhini TaxID=83891 RepID=A0A3R7N9N3_9TRYP|nr:uncharacterized protein Tco025E_00129 [Trypanosoma conorhini]RNF27745.1 hypothetical protein Tco025E_00129 [Trypanosoma conorhini]
MLIKRKRQVSAVSKETNKIWEKKKEKIIITRIHPPPNKEKGLVLHHTDGEGDCCTEHAARHVCEHVTSVVHPTRRPHTTALLSLFVLELIRRASRFQPKLSLIDISCC